MIADGITSFTVISTVAVALPPVLDAVIVYVVNEDTTVGVPLISPVVPSKFKPLGSDGEIVQDVIIPPLAVGDTEDIAVPTVSTNELGL